MTKKITGTNAAVTRNATTTTGVIGKVLVEGLAEGLVKGLAVEMSK